MSKQYLAIHTLANEQPTDIFSLAVTATQIASASGSSSINIHSTRQADFPLVQTLENAHPLGCHHMATSKYGTKAASIGFGGDMLIWSISESGNWTKQSEIIESNNTTGELWAIALSGDGRYLAGTTHNGRIITWETSAEPQKIREYETKGSFGLCIDMSVDGVLTACGQENGSVYIFNNSTGRMLHSLLGLVKPVRAVRFSPGTTLLASAGDSRTIALHDVSSGEQVANLTGHEAWIMSLDWSFTGDYLLSGAFDGKTKVWSIDQRACVATHTESDKPVWSVKWLPKTEKVECFAIAGANRSISLFREVTGG